MRNYQKITQNADGQLLAWYDTLDHTGDRQLDFDVWEKYLEDYRVYQHETWSYIAEYTPTLYAFWSYATLEEALDAVLQKTNKNEYQKVRVECLVDEFQNIAKKNSLDERYKDKVVETPQKQLSPYLQKLRVRTEEMHAEIEKTRSEKNWKLANAEYYERLLLH
jgi:hypothetical protein